MTDKKANSDGAKKKLTKEQIEALLKKTCVGRQWLIMKRVENFNSLGAFLKANGVTEVKLGEEALSYQIVDQNKTCAAAFILTRREGQPGGRKEGSTWFIAAMMVAPDFRRQKLSDTMVNKVTSLLKDRQVDEVYVELGKNGVPDDIEGASDEKGFWEASGFTDAGQNLLVLKCN